MGEFYEALRVFMRESDLRAYIAAVQILRAAPHLTNVQKQHAVYHWLICHHFFPERCLQVRQRLNFDALPPETFRAYFRFSRHHIGPLRQMLGIPEQFDEGDHKLHGDDALLVLLRRLGSPQRHIDLEDEFGLSSAFMSDIALSLVKFLHCRWSRLLFSAPGCWTPERLALYADAVSEKVYLLTGVHWPAALLWHIVGFLDGSFHDTDRPSDQYRGQNLQESAYSGYEKGHGLRFHHLLFPCGIIGHVSLFLAGRQNDAALWTASMYFSQFRELCGIDLTIPIQD